MSENLRRRIVGRATAITGAAVLLSTSAATLAIPANAAGTVPPPAGQGHGYSTGDVVFADALNVPQINVAKISVANSAAGVFSDTTTDDLSQPMFLGDLTGKNAFGHAAGVNLGLLQAYTAAPQAQLTIAEAASPPPKPVQTSLVDLSDTPLKPLVSAKVQPDIATAQTTTAANACVLGGPISAGQANVAEAQVLNVDNGGTPINVVSVDQAVQSTSSMSLAQPSTAPGTVKAGQSGLSLVSATQIDTTGVTLFRGTPAEITVKLLAPLRLAAVAGPTADTTYATYAPVGAGTGPTSPVLSVTAGGSTQTLTLQQITGSSGIIIHLGIADVEIGGAPTVTRPDGNSATSIKATADLVKVTIPDAATTIGVASNGPLAPLTGALDQIATALTPVLQPIQAALTQAGLGVADLRIGHFESSAAVPAGGVVCPPRTLPATKTASPTSTTAGHDITYAITFENPYSDCTVTNATITDAIEVTSGSVQYSITQPAGSPADKVTFTGITIPPKQKVTKTVVMHVDSGAGTIHDTASITGQCVGSTGAGADVTGGAGLDVGSSAAGGPGAVTVSGSASATVTVGQAIVAGEQQQTPSKQLAFTGGNPMLPVAGLVLVAGAAVLRRRRSAPPA